MNYLESFKDTDWSNSHVLTGFILMLITGVMSCFQMLFQILKIRKNKSTESIVSYSLTMQMALFIVSFSYGLNSDLLAMFSAGALKILFSSILLYYFLKYSTVYSNEFLINTSDYFPKFDRLVG
jgi:uncharacterized protein with PQ loop repeat